MLVEGGRVGGGCACRRRVGELEEAEGGACWRRVGTCRVRELHWLQCYN